MQTIIDRLKKIEALARSGIAGERENAQRLLTELCEKHGVTLEQLATEERKLHRFPVRDSLDEQLLTQVVVYVCRTRAVRNAKYKGAWWYELTAAQAVDVAECFAHYRKLWKQQLSDIMLAFITKNGIFGPREERDDNEPDAEAVERALRIRSLMTGLKADRWSRPAALLTA